MSWLYGRPTAAELVAAVAGFLEKDVRNATGSADAGQVNFHARVAANVLRIVERELLDTSSGEVTEALRGIGYRDEPELAAGIRSGELDDRAAELLPVLRTVVRHRLDVNHPGY
ncbi:hypothetical protein H7I77_23740 [Mycolicibacterium novocastrense]|uniref:Aminoglycoside phosphotransferase n=1 Tax=Mycolicibacterium novocastrense TaxID=59813 RepID=A0AAW5SRV6_MYCNV|nr:DUF6285 domain-containing protein [Mycolicibacterium novocastrense]MCV7026327.1 hypothetical protein [Mycolicibacterium novocastrense]GAT07435.1 aminoglycoside phosphotransferase [Mycolicibacterium novocastrense]